MRTELLTGKKILHTALAMAMGGVLLWTGPGWAMDAADAPETVEIGRASCRERVSIDV